MEIWQQSREHLVMFTLPISTANQYTPSHVRRGRPVVASWNVDEELEAHRQRKGLKKEKRKKGFCRHSFHTCETNDERLPPVNKYRNNETNDKKKNRYILKQINKMGG